PALPRPPTEQHHRHGAEQDAQVEPERPVVNVLKIQFHPALKALDLVSPAHLPQARESRLHGETAALRRCLKLLYFVNRQWSRSDETHLATQHIPKLRKLIERGLAQETASWSDARIPLDFEDRATHLIE